MQNQNQTKSKQNKKTITKNQQKTPVKKQFDWEKLRRCRRF